MDYQYVYKLIIVGDTGVGKSCLVSKYCTKKFNALHEMTVGVDFGSTVVEIMKDKIPIRIKIQLWDTAGQEAFRSITRSYYKSSSGVILCYDITRMDSFEHITQWLEDIRSICHQNTPIILLGTKCDLESKRVVSTEMVQQFAEQHNLLFHEISSKTNINVTESFTDLLLTIYDAHMSGTELEGITETNNYKYPVTLKTIINEKSEQQLSKSCCKN